MKTKSLCIAISLAISIAIGFLLYARANNSNCSNNCRIALFLPAIHPSMDVIEKNFAATIKNTIDDCTLTTYNAGGNKTLLHAQAEEIVQTDYNLIFTVGTSCTQTVYELCKKKQKKHSGYIHCC